MVPTKRHSSAKAKSSSLSGMDKVSIVQEYGQGLVGSRIRVWWPLDRKFYEGVAKSYSSSRRKHRVLYDDGDEENLDMKKQKWELIEEDEDTLAEEISLEEAAAEESSDGTPEPADRKKTKAGKRKVVATMPKKTDSSAKSKLGNVGGKIVAAASRMSVRFQRKENGQPKALSARKNTAASDIPKRKRASSSSEAGSEKVKKPRASSRKMKSNNPDDEDTSDDDSKPLMSFLNKLKGKKEKEGGERSSRNRVEEGSSGSEAGEEDSEKESGEDSSENESGESSSENEAAEASEGEEGSERSEEEGESTGNETDE